MSYENMKLRLGNIAKENLSQILIVALKQASNSSKVPSKSTFTKL